MGQLLSFARERSQPGTVWLANDVVARSLDLVRSAVGKSVDVTANLTEIPAHLEGNATSLTNALLNLATNARDAMSKVGTLHITTKTLLLDREQCKRLAEFKITPGGYYAITVADSGSGIAGDALPHIFEPFFTSKPQGHGTGLGLASVYAAVRSFGGAIEVESDVGIGTRFHILLPLFAGKMSQPQPSVMDSSPAWLSIRN